jgi:hypothetical protein
MKTNHTPGPWKYDDCNSITAGECDAVGVCILEPLPDFWAGAVDCHPEGEEYEANARLIAAAPDLLAACLEFQEWDKSNCQDDLHSWATLKDLMNAALAKALGEQS